MHTLFPQLPEELAALSTDELRELLQQFRTVAKSIRDGDADLSELGATDEERATAVVEQMRAAKEATEAIKGELAAKVGAETNFVEETSQLAAEIGADDEAGEGEAGEEVVEVDVDVVVAENVVVGEEAAEGEEPAAEEVEEPAVEEPVAEVVLAAAVETPAAPRRFAIPRGPDRYSPQLTEETMTALVAAANLESLSGRNYREGTPLTRGALVDATLMLAKRLGPIKKVRGGGEQRFTLASAHWSYPDEFTLKAGDHEGNMAKLIAVGSPFLGREGIEAVVASGGICAPPTPFYDVPGFATRARPVRDGEPVYGAARGGVSIPTVNTIDRADAGVTVIEESEDAQGGTFATKACRTVECATWVDTFVGIISHCLEVGNLNARTWPEGVALENDNLLAGHAATAETRLLNRIKALSIGQTDTTVYNAVHGLIYAIVRLKASVSNLLRADPGIGYTVLLPHWVPDMLVADLAAQSGTSDRYVAQAQIEAYLSRVGVSVIWYLDSPTGENSQLFDVPEEGAAIDNFPNPVQWGFHINGEFIVLDQGDLELGLVRDSNLNHTNDYELFGETFENIARVGPTVGARWITSTICPDGTFPALQTALACA